MNKEQHDFAIYILQASINLTEKTLILTNYSETSFVFIQSATHMPAHKGVKIANLCWIFRFKRLKREKENIFIKSASALREAFKNYLADFVC